MEKEKENNKESLKNISSKHLESISESLSRIEYHSRIGELGFENIEEVIMKFNPNLINDDSIRTVIMLSNQKFLIFEFRNLLVKVKHLISSIDYKNFSSRTKLFEDILTNNFKHKDKLFLHSKTTRNQITKKSIITAGTGYDYISISSPKLREDFLEKLSHILFSIDLDGEKKEW